MKLAFLALAALVTATPLPNADADADADPGAVICRSEPCNGPAIPYPKPGVCTLGYCIRAPCLQSCCRESMPSLQKMLTVANKQQYCPWGYSCYGSPPKCCPPGWWCDGTSASGGIRGEEG